MCKKHIFALNIWVVSFTGEYWCHCCKSRNLIFKVIYTIDLLIYFNEVKEDISPIHHFEIWSPAHSTHQPCPSKDHHIHVLSQMQHFKSRWTAFHATNNFRLRLLVIATVFKLKSQLVMGAKSQTWDKTGGAYLKLIHHHQHHHGQNQIKATLPLTTTIY